MTFRPRKAWTDVPAANSHRVLRPFLKGVAIHWVGPAVPAKVYAGDEAAVAQYLRGVWRFHTSPPRSWSDIAYNLAVDSKGRIWDLRGLSYISAANGDSDVNTQYLAVVALVGEGQEPTPEMLAGLRHAVRRCRLRYPWHCTRIVGHRDVRPEPTACPGDALYLQIKRGTFVPFRFRRKKK